MPCCDRRRLLTIMTSACTCAAFGLLSIAVATDYWLYTLEPVENHLNLTSPYRKLYSGLWKKCEHLGRDGLRVRCSYINYFNLDDQDEPSPTRSILASVRRATVFPLCSLLLLLIGGIICFVGHCHTRKIILTFISGVMFVLAGLCTLVGLILYIGSITGEGGSKSMPGPTDKQPKFIYHYGSSFMMAVGSFSLTELAGVFSVYLYISRYKHLQMTEQKNTVVTQLNDKSNQWRHRRSRSQSRDRPQSRDGSVSRSESYFTYTPVSETSHELSNYTFPREVSRNTISTTAETHVIKEQSVHSVDTIRRTTPV